MNSYQEGLLFPLSVSLEPCFVPRLHVLDDEAHPPKVAGLTPPLDTLDHGAYVLERGDAMGTITLRGLDRETILAAHVGSPS